MESDRVTQTAALFDRSAAYYDCVNSVICLNMDSLWRRWAASRALAAAQARRAGAGAAAAEDGTATRPTVRPATGPVRVLDAFGGTGLVALEMARRGALVALADASPGMLAVAQQRARQRRLALDVVCADLTARPATELPGAPFDAITLAFGLRYVTDPAGLLRGLSAALAPGGTIVLLEAVVPRGGPLAVAAGAYFFEVAPRVATALAGRAELYAELTATVRALGGAADLLRHVGAAGLGVRERRLFAGGVVAGIVASSASGMFSVPARH